LVALWSVALGTSVLFYRVDNTAGLLLLPYIGWLSFANVLNFASWRINGVSGEKTIKQN